MHTDSSTATIDIDAPVGRVLRTLRDVATQPDWVPEIVAAEVVSTDHDGRPAVARFRARTPVGSDEYTLAYQHRADGLSWSLLKGGLQTGQDASYTVRSAGRGRSDVTFALRISHNLPLPGVIRRRVVRGIVDGTVRGLKAYVEADEATRRPDARVASRTSGGRAARR